MRVAGEELIADSVGSQAQRIARCPIRLWPVSAAGHGTACVGDGRHHGCESPGPWRPPPAAGVRRRRGQGAGTSSGPRVQAGLEQLGTVGQDEQRPARRRRREVRQERPGRRLVEVLGRLVEDEDPDVGEQRPGEREALPLTPGQAGAVLPDRRLEAVRAATGPSRAAAPVQRPLELRHVRRPGRASRRLSAIVASKMCGSCSHRPTARRTSSPGIERTSTALPCPRPAPATRPSGSRNRRQAAASVLLPEPLGPVTTRRAPARQVEVQRPPRLGRPAPG